MKFGKLFKKFQATFHMENYAFTANRCSELTRRELMMMAHKMYFHNDRCKSNLLSYMNKPTDQLAYHVFEALKNI